jgi:hypothetical protein
MIKDDPSLLNDKHWRQQPAALAGWVFVALLAVGLVLYGLLGSPVTVERLSLTLTLLFFLVALFIAGFQIYLATRSDTVIAELKEISRGTRDGVDKVRDLMNPEVLKVLINQAISEQDDPDEPDIDAIASRVSDLAAPSLAGDPRSFYANMPLDSISGLFREIARHEGWKIDRAPTTPDFLTVVSKSRKHVVARSTKRGRRTIEIFRETLETLLQLSLDYQGSEGIDASATVLLVDKPLSAEFSAVADEFRTKNVRVVPKHQFVAFLTEITA